MADRDFSTLISRVNPSVPGCPYQTMLQYIRESAIRTCERTLAWRYIPPKFNLDPGVYEYVHEIPTDTAVHAIFEAVVNGTPLERLTLEQAIRKYPLWANLFSGEDPSVAWSDTESGGINVDVANEGTFNDQETYVVPPEIVAEASTPRSITQVTPDKYIILPLPDADQTYEMRMFYALKPTRTAVGMDNYIFSELEDAIVHGALQQLLVLPQVSWADRELAAYHAKQYILHTTERRARSNMGNNRASLTVQMRPLY